MRRVANMVVTAMALACLASEADAGLIEVTVTGQVESLVDWPVGLVPGESVLFSYVIDADAPLIVEGPNLAAFIFQSSFFQAGNHSISGTQGPLEINGFAFIDPIKSEYLADVGYAAPFMNATNSLFRVSLNLVDETGAAFPRFPLHPMEIDFADFSDVEFQATLNDFSGGPLRELMITPVSMQIAAVPEPGTLGLLLLGVATASCRRRRVTRRPRKR